MKKNLLFLSLSLIIITTAGSGCSDNNNSPSQPESKDIVMFSDYLGANDTIKDEEEISLHNDVVSSITLYFKTSYDSLNVSSQWGCVEIKKLKQNSYKCTILRSGADEILISPYEKNIKGTTNHLYLRISKTDYFCSPLYGASYAVEGPTGNVKDGILNDLKQHFASIYMLFDYTSPNGGNFESGYTDNNNNKITFTTTFTPDSIYNESEKSIEKYQFTYNKQICGITIMPQYNGGANMYYSITEDFTKYYQNKYPSAGITSATITCATDHRDKSYTFN